MVKRYDFKNFNVGGENGFEATCYTTDTRNGFCHTCVVDGLTDTKISYFNRTWETYDYETVLRVAIKKYNKVFKTDYKSVDVQVLHR